MTMELNNLQQFLTKEINAISNNSLRKEKSIKVFCDQEDGKNEEKVFKKAKKKKKAKKNRNYQIDS